MFGFGRKRQEPRPEGTAKTFVEATGGGWGDGPEVVEATSHTDYVGEVLAAAREYAQTRVAVGESFEYRITDIPRGICSPIEIILPLMMRAGEFGLSPGPMYNETASFTRLE